jgi:esterase/lipase
VDQPNRVKNVIRWSIIVCCSFFLVTLIFVLLIDFEFVRNPGLAEEYYFRIVLSLLAIFFSLLIIRILVFALANRLNNEFLKTFKHHHELGVYAKSASRRSTSFHGKKGKHAVLLLHSFSGSPDEFRHLYAELEEQGIYFIAPNVLGFGLDSTQLLEKVRYQDWFRQALNYYDILESLFDKVSIIGQSMGAILATYIAESRRPNCLILTGPGLNLPKGDLKYKRFLFAPGLSSFFSWFIPYLPKQIRPGRISSVDMCDESNVDRVFQYLAVPVNSAKQVLIAQSHVVKNLDDLNYNNLLVLYGKHDKSTSSKELIDHFKLRDLKFQYHCFENTGHNVFADYDKEEAVKLTMQFIVSNND